MRSIARIHILKHVQVLDPCSGYSKGLLLKFSNSFLRWVLPAAFVYIVNFTVWHTPVAKKVDAQHHVSDMSSIFMYDTAMISKIK